MGLKRARVEAPMASVERDPMPEATFDAVTTDPRPKKTILDSLRFLETMKRELAASEMDKYYEFIAVMRTFKAGRMDAKSVADYVKALLAGHPELIRGFSEFLPWDYIRSHGALGGSGI
ncbi:unnamed protein product [Urochloa decumbens]|uniref:Uncharacterized protein n=1 Tax=Urochloa decumbens TaxID=240449 RepID=A0ABC9BV31_9POAL